MTNAGHQANRLEAIDKLKGLAIFLVVLGHLVAREPPEGNAWYVVLRDTIYLFHMPLFMFLSGLILGYSRKPISDWPSYGKYLAGKFKRLMPAYFFFSAVVFFGKLFAAQFLHVDNAPESWLSYFDVIIDPLGSYSAFLWYIQVLFLFYAIAPLGYYLTGQRIHFLLPLCLLLHFVPLPNWFGLSSLGEYAFVFCLGCLAGEHYPQYVAWLKRHGAITVPIFLIALLGATSWGIPKLVLGLLSIPACHLLCGLWAKDRWQIWSTLGYYTFSIYLMNTLFIGLTKSVLLKFSNWDGNNFIWFAPLLLLAGLAGPITTSEVYERLKALPQKWPLKAASHRAKEKVAAAG